MSCQCSTTSNILLCLITFLITLSQINSHQIRDYPPPTLNIGYGYPNYPSSSYLTKYPFNYFEQHRISPISSTASGDPYAEQNGLWRYRDRYQPPPRTYHHHHQPGSMSPSYATLYGQPSSSASSSGTIGSAYNVLPTSSSYYAFENKFSPPNGPANFADANVPFDNRYGWFPRYPMQSSASSSSMNSMFTNPLPPPQVSPAIMPHLISPYNFPMHRVARAVAEVRGGSENSNKITGSISFEQEENDHVIIRGKIVGVPPGAHGLHILEKSLVGPDCTSGGEHYNPQKTDHGGKHDWIRHVGDLGNIYSDRDGIAYFDLTDQIISLTGGYSILNRTIVITEKPDDLGRSGDAESKKTGNSGLPIACGLIELAKFSSN